MEKDLGIIFVQIKTIKVNTFDAHIQSGIKKAKFSTTSTKPLFDLIWSMVM